MDNAILQFWGGGFYLLNKFFFSRAERSATPRTNRRWRILSWIVYIVGVPAWVIIFVYGHNWMAAAVEAGGGVTMFFGLIAAIRGRDSVPTWLKKALEVFTYALLGAAIYHSILEYGGITTVTQMLEIGVVAGFLVGTYQLGERQPRGYIWFMLMNGSNAGLMFVEHYPLLVLQQLAYLGFVIDAFMMYRRRLKIGQTQGRAQLK